MESTQPKFSFRAEEITFLEFSIIKGQIDSIEDLNPQELLGFEVENSLRLSYNVEDKLVKADLKTDFLSVSANLEPVLAKGSYHLVFVYKVENLDKLISFLNENKIEADPLLSNTLAAITYSTSRGILMTRMQGTVFQNFILPIIDPNTLLQNPD